MNLAKILKSHPYWLFAFGISCIAGLIGMQDEFNENYISIALFAQLRLAPLYCALVLFSFLLSDIFFSKRRYLFFILSLGLLIVVGTVAAETISPYIQNDIADSSETIHFISICFMVSIGHYIRSIKYRIQRKYEYQEYKAQKTEAELKLLKQQINPHFLFNTLNSIYVHALELKPQTPEMVMNLSEMLRYQLESNAKENIALEKEIEFLTHYLYFEKRRLPANVQINFNYEVDKPHTKIAPNLLMPLIENVFKHGLLIGEPCVVEIDLTLKNGELNLHTQNKFNEIPNKNSTGIGLNNLRKRLVFLYESRFTLHQEKIGNHYHAKLAIQSLK
jgi:LytS/YehU family sensor histidine kinase